MCETDGRVASFFIGACIDHPNKGIEEDLARNLAD
jgi:hypothetical protein